MWYRDSDFQKSFHTTMFGDRNCGQGSSFENVDKNSSKVLTNDSLLILLWSGMSVGSSGATADIPDRRRKLSSLWRLRRPQRNSFPILATSGKLHPLLSIPQIINTVGMA
jgi:hypothetical protein